MRRKVSPFVVAIPAFIVLLIFQVWPFLTGIVMSLQKFNPKLGLMNSPAIGLTNYADLLGSYYFWRLLRNTFILTFLPAAVTCVVSFLAAVFILKLPNKWSRCLALSIIAIPAFIPTSVLIGVVKNFVDSDSMITGFLYSVNLIGEKANLLAMPAMYPWIYTVVETLKFMFYPIAAGVLVAYDTDNHYIQKLGRISIGYLLLRLAFMFAMSKEISISLYNPMVFETADTLNSFTFRKGLLEANYGFSAAVDTIKLILQVILNSVLLIGLKRLFFRDSITVGLRIAKKSGTGTLIGIIGSVIMCLGGLSFIYFVITGATSSAFSAVFNNPSLSQALANSFIYSLCSSVLLTFLAVFLAYPLTAKGKVYPVVLFMLLALDFSIGQYMLIRSMGAIDSAVGAILPAGVSVAGAFVLRFLTWDRTNETVDFRDYLRRVIPAVLIVFGLGFILTWGSGESMYYLQTRTHFPISLFVREVLVQNDMTKLFSEANSETQLAAVKAVLCMIASLPPLIVGWALIWSSKRMLSKKSDESETVS